MRHQDRLEHFTDQLLKLGKGMGDILQDVAAYPDSPELNLAAAIILLYGQTQENNDKAIQHLNQTQKFEKELAPQYLSLLHATQKWASRDMTETLNSFETHCDQYPQDLLAIKVTEFIFYCNGQKYCSDRFLKMTTHAYPLHKDNGCFLSMHAFAQELNGDLIGAQQTAEEGIKIEHENPWAHHTLSHVYLNSGQIEPGISALERFSQEWPLSSRIIQSHNLWHLALMYFENLQIDRVRHVIERADWHQKASLVTEEIDAAALLWRLDMLEPAHQLWKPIAAAINGHVEFSVIPFASAQLLYGLKRAGYDEEVKQRMSKTSHYVSQLHGDEQTKWQKVGLPLIEGALAFAENDFAGTTNKWEPIIDEIPSVGGSDAQVDLFNIAFHRALINLKLKSEANHFLQKLTFKRPLTEREKSWQNE